MDVEAWFENNRDSIERKERLDAIKEALRRAEEARDIAADGDGTHTLPVSSAEAVIAGLNAAGRTETEARERIERYLIKEFEYAFGGPQGQARAKEAALYARQMGISAAEGESDSESVRGYEEHDCAPSFTVKDAYLYKISINATGLRWRQIMVPSFDGSLVPSYVPMYHPMIPLYH